MKKEKFFSLKDSTDSILFFLMDKFKMSRRAARAHLIYALTRASICDVIWEQVDYQKKNKKIKELRVSL